MLASNMQSIVQLEDMPQGQSEENRHLFSSTFYGRYQYPGLIPNWNPLDFDNSRAPGLSSIPFMES